jgi:hypothetical protein
MRQNSVTSIPQYLSGILFIADRYARICLQVIERSHPNYTQCPKCGNAQLHLGGSTAVFDFNSFLLLT